MQALANISQFESLSENASQSNLGIFNPEQTAVENAITPITPVSPVPSDLPPPLPQWRKTVDERLGNLERTMATKADLTAMKEELKTLIKQR